jgi:hypothetical protein
VEIVYIFFDSESPLLLGYGTGTTVVVWAWSRRDRDVDRRCTWAIVLIARNIIDAGFFVCASHVCVAVAGL